MINSFRIIDLLNTRFRDYPIMVDGIVHDDVNRTLKLPIVAPDWSEKIESEGCETPRARDSKCATYQLTVHNVQAVTISYSEDHKLNEIELGSVQCIAPNEMLIEGHYILKIRVVFDGLDLSLCKLDMGH